MAHPRSSVLVRCEVVWYSSELDAALLLAEENVLSTDQAAVLGNIRLGELGTESPLPHCEIIGFPDIQRYGAEGRLDLDRYTGTVLPIAGRLRGDLTCALELSPTTKRDDDTSPLAGLSGSPLFAGPVLLGLVSEIPKERNHQRVAALAIAHLMADKRFCDQLSLLDVPFRQEHVTDFHRQDLRYEQEYPNAVSARYRKTEILACRNSGATRHLGSGTVPTTGETEPPFRQTAPSRPWPPARKRPARRPSPDFAAG